MCTTLTYNTAYMKTVMQQLIFQKENHIPHTSSCALWNAFRIRTRIRMPIHVYRTLGKFTLHKLKKEPSFSRFPSLTL